MPREFSYQDAALRLNCSRTKVSHFVNDGRIKVVRRDKPAGQHGRVWLSSEDVERVAKEWKRERRPADRSSASTDRRIDGALAAKCYRLFHEGLPDAHVVMALEIDPLLVRRLRALYEATPEREAQIASARKKEALEIQAQRDHSRTVRAAARAQVELEKAKILARAHADAVRQAEREAARAARSKSP